MLLAVVALYDEIYWIGVKHLHKIDVIDPALRMFVYILSIVTVIGTMYTGVIRYADTYPGILDDRILAKFHMFLVIM